MKLHSVFISHNRLELTKVAIASYLETVTAPFSLCVVDNASNDGTPGFLTEWLSDGLGWPVILLDENRYPGYACNRGWELASEDVTFLHRADNDFKFLPGWCDEIERSFNENERLGQLGLRTGDEELHNGHNVGGNCVLRRELWDAGLRYDETPWPEIEIPGYTEDSFMSPRVTHMGWEWGRVKRRCIQSISFEDSNDPYYQKTWADRGITRE